MRKPSEAWPRTAGASDSVGRDPHVGKEMLALISLRNFTWSGHIDAFRSIVGDGAGPQVPFANIGSAYRKGHELLRDLHSSVSARK